MPGTVLTSYYNAGALPDLKIAWGEMIVPVETRVGPQQNIFSVSQKLPFPGKLSLQEDIGMAESREDMWRYHASIEDLKYKNSLHLQ